MRAPAREKLPDNILNNHKRPFSPGRWLYESSLVPKPFSTDNKEKETMMKRLITVLLILCIPLGLVFSAEVFGGAKAGAAFGWGSGSDWVDGVNFLDDAGRGQPTKVRFGGSFGGYLVFEASANFAAQIEILYSSLGAGFSVTNSGADIDAKQWANLLQWPLLLRIQSPSQNGVIYALIGASPMVILGDIHTEVQSGSSTAGGTVTPDNTFNLAIITGAGYAFPLGPGRLDIELRFLHTMLDIFKNDNSRLNSIDTFFGYSVSQ